MKIVVKNNRIFECSPSLDLDFSGSCEGFVVFINSCWVPDLFLVVVVLRVGRRVVTVGFPIIA